MKWKSFRPLSPTSASTHTPRTGTDAPVPDRLRHVGRYRLCHDKQRLTDTGKHRTLCLNTGSLRIDTATLRLDQRGSLIDYRTHIGNAPGTLDEFAQVNINGYLGGNRASVFLNQQNIQGKTGYRLGLTAAVMDSLVTVHFSPLKATIAYLPWTLNADNHVEYTFADSRIDANLRAQSAESSIMLLTEPRNDGGEDLHVNLKNIHIEDFLRDVGLRPAAQSLGERGHAASACAARRLWATEP